MSFVLDNPNFHEGKWILDDPTLTYIPGVGAWGSALAASLINTDGFKVASNTFFQLGGAQARAFVGKPTGSISFRDFYPDAPVITGGGNEPPVQAGSTFYIAPSTLGLDSREPLGDTSIPDIQVSGATADRSTITVTTSTLDFGTAPTVYLAYSGDADIDGQVITPVASNGATIDGQTANTVCVDNGYGASKAWAATTNAVTYQVRLGLPDVTKLFTSFKYKNNGRWSGATGWPNYQGEPSVIPNDSTWKMTWVAANPADVGSKANTNLCLPTHNGGDHLSIAGNSHNMASNILDGMQDTFGVFNDWSSVEVYIEAGSPLNDPSGYGVFSKTSPMRGRYETTYTGAVFDPNNTDTAFKRLNIPGWIDDYAELTIWYSDIYVANSPSRILIGDHSILSKCRYTSVCPHSSWSSQSITAELHVPHDKDTNLYLFVIDETGLAHSTIGVPVLGGNI